MSVNDDIMQRKMTDIFDLLSRCGRPDVIYK